MGRIVTAAEVHGLRADRLGDPLGLGFPYTVDPRIAGATQNVGAVNRAIYARVTGGGTITKIGLLVGTSSGNIDVGVFTSTGVGRSARPNVRLRSSGATACPTAGYAEVSLGGSVVVQSGDWLAIAADNTTATFGAISSPGASDLVAGLLHYQDNGYTLPAAAAVTAAGMRAICLVGVA